MSSRNARRPRAGRTLPSLVLLATVAATACSGTPEEAEEAAAEACAVMPEDVDADDPMAGLGHSLIILEFYREVEHLVSVEEFQEALERQCPETMRQIDEVEVPEALTPARP